MTNDSFEATYPRYDFAPLVRIGLAIAAMIKGSRIARDAGNAPRHANKGAVGSAA